MTAKQTFKKAFSAARSMRAQAAGQAEFSAEHGRFFTSYKFKTDVCNAVDIAAHMSSPVEFRAACAAAEVVATEMARAARPVLSLPERLAAMKAAEVYDFAVGYI